ncbi:hypothetical protein B0H17DRAFT_1093154 [Mycena rosella]|uniref:intramembrane prenyl-peptidase Rce1 n=1 Tax=Mycena rosella TaxID=1033263 RepID=A0AAD7CTT3_MYCRO|nr:hypothetical protein B0H17DRAFT_1093154 [Mycena rosella]
MPPLTPFTSHLLALLFSSSYVGSIYVARSARTRLTSSNAGSRDDPPVIRARLIAATLTSAFNCVVLYVVVARSDYPLPWNATLAMLGVSWPATILSCLQTPVLFLGPLYASFVASTLPGQAHYSVKRDFSNVFCTWIGFRNYLWGPLTEEIVFRACVLAVYALCSARRGMMIAFAPLMFGLAHVHHAWDTYTRGGRTTAALKRALISTLFQAAYTTLFGAHASFLFLRTSSLLPPLTAHIFCNIMGIPQLGYELRRTPAYRTSIQVAYVLGIVGFAGTLVPWTAVPAGGEESLYWRAPEMFARFFGA